MTLLFLRLLSWITGFLGVAAALWQWRAPLEYPWPMFVFLVWYFFALCLLGVRRLGWRDTLEKGIPSFLALIALILGALLAESSYERGAVTVLFGLIPFLVLELLFLLSFGSPRYPVNALSHVNLSMVPVGAFFLGSSLSGLSVFLRTPFWVPALAFAFFSALGYFLTSHPSADRRHRRRWGLLGGFVGVHVGLLGAFLPLGMFAQGAISAVCLGIPLRIRRYSHAPKPSRKFAWVEGVLAVIVTIGLLLSAKWV